MVELDGARVLFANLHLHHEVPATTRSGTSRRASLLDWLASAPRSDVQVVVGDFNADPAEPAYARMVTAGFRSACLEANGSEPRVTWPSGLQGPAIDTDGEPSCLDYIWVRGDAAVARPGSSSTVRPSTTPACPSDHFGLSARLELGRSRR